MASPPRNDSFVTPESGDSHSRVLHLAPSSHLQTTTTDPFYPDDRRRRMTQNDPSLVSPPFRRRRKTEPPSPCRVSPYGPSTDGGQGCIFIPQIVKLLSGWRNVKCCFLRAEREGRGHDNDGCLLIAEYLDGIRRGRRHRAPTFEHVLPPCCCQTYNKLGTDSFLVSVRTTWPIRCWR